jgi:two-component system phosphate regulon response regulator PhoB
MDTETLHFATLREAERHLASKSTGPVLILTSTCLSDATLGTLLDFLQGIASNPCVAFVMWERQLQLANVLMAFAAGAEDCFDKDVHVLELRARLAARLDKLSKLQRSAQTVAIGPLTLTPALLRVSMQDGIENRDIPLTAKEFKLLLHMAQNPGVVFARSALVRTLWGDSVHVLERTVDSHICGLRKKLGAMGPRIRSVPGHGYFFEPAQEVLHGERQISS